MSKQLETRTTAIILNAKDFDILKRNHISFSPLIRELINKYIKEKDLK